MAKGAFGSVYSAYHQDENKFVCLKLI